MTDVKLEDAERVALTIQRLGETLGKEWHPCWSEGCESAAALLRKIPELTSQRAYLDQKYLEAQAKIDAHNAEVSQTCGLGDQEGVSCGYRPYFPRRCSQCPKRNWSIE